MRISGEDLKKRQEWPLDMKEEFTLRRIRNYVDVISPLKPYVSFSGGKDSTVLLHLARRVYPEMRAVFVDTGLEYPEIREFVKTIDNVEWLYPKKSFIEVIRDYGYPVVSKEVSKNISRCVNTKNPIQREYRLFGTKNGVKTSSRGVGVIPKKWHHLVNTPFKISDRCCDIMKKNPIKIFNGGGWRPIIGEMASESNRRKMNYMKTGCNSFDIGKEISRPMGFWKEEDIWAYIHKYKIPYSRIYDMGERRTGCMFCMFGCHMEEHPNRFERMKITHPSLHKYCMTQLGIEGVLKTLNLG